MNVDDFADDNELELLLLEPRSAFDSCIVGIVERFHSTFVLYDKEKIIEALVRDGLNYDEAIEHFDFNMNGGWYGEGTWGFLSRRLDP